VSKQLLLTRVNKTVSMLERQKQHLASKKALPV
jgi:hypothetical protein